MLRYRLNAMYGIYSSVAVQGFNTYGGGFGTMGRVTPGAVSTVTIVTIVGEYGMTHRLVLALDIGFQTVNATNSPTTPASMPKADRHSWDGASAIWSPSHRRCNTVGTSMWVCRPVPG